MAPRATSTTRSSRSAARRRPRRPARRTASAWSTPGNFIAEAEVDPFDTARVRIGISPNTFAWTLEPGEAFTTPGGDPGLLRVRPRGDERRAPPPLPRAAGPRALARPAAARPDQQLGGDVLRLRRGEAAPDRRGGARPRRRAVRPRRRLVRGTRRRHDVARRLVRRSAQAARTGSPASPRRSRRWASGSGSGSSRR